MTQDKPPLTTLLGQTIVMTSLDPVPRAMRTAPGCVVMNQRERDAIANNDGALWKDLIAMIQEDDRARLIQGRAG
jgi:hypothetical protein